MAVPLRDDSPRRRVPWVVLTLIGLNVAVFLLLQPPSLQRGEADTGSLSPTETQELADHFASWGAVPCEVRHLESRAHGARCSDPGGHPIVERKSVPVSLFTAMFLHGSLAHLASNMLFLWVFGAAVEDRFGSGAFLGLYLGGGLLATLTYVALNPGSAEPLAGASGAVSAAMGAYLLIGARRRIYSFVYPLPIVALTLPAWALLGPYVVSQFVVPDDIAVAWQAHLGGIAAGFLIAIVLRLLQPRPGEWRRFRRHPADAAPEPLDPSTWVIPAEPPLEEASPSR